MLIFLIRLQFGYNDAAGPNEAHKELKKIMSKIIKSGEEVNGEFTIYDEVLGEGSTSIVYRGG